MKVTRSKIKRFAQNLKARAKIAIICLNCTSLSFVSTHPTLGLPLPPSLRLNWQKPSDKNKKRSVTSVLLSMSGKAALERATKTIFTGVKPNPTIKIVRHELPREYFIENRKNVTVEKIDGRFSFVRVNNEIVREKHIFSPPSSEEDCKQSALLNKKARRKAVDRRLIVQNYTDPPYAPMCFLRGIYNLTPKEKVTFSGTGFRNANNQIITAGHNLFLEKSYIEETCAKRRIALNDYSFHNHS